MAESISNLGVILGVNNRIKKKKFKIELLKCKPDDILILYYKAWEYPVDCIQEVLKELNKETGKEVIALPQDMELRARSAAP